MMNTFAAISAVFLCTLFGAITVIGLRERPDDDEAGSARSSKFEVRSSKLE